MLKKLGDKLSAKDSKSTSKEPKSSSSSSKDSAAILTNNTTIPTLLYGASQKHKHPVLITPKEKLTVEQIRRKALDVAFGLMKLGLAPKQRVLFYGPPSLEWVITEMAVIMTGAVPLLLQYNHWVKPSPEINCRYIMACLRRYKPKFMITGEDIALPISTVFIGMVEKVFVVESPTQNTNIMATLYDPLTAWTSLVQTRTPDQDQQISERTRLQTPTDVCLEIIATRSMITVDDMDPDFMGYKIEYTHDNIVFTTSAVANAMSLTKSDRIATYLPYATIYGQIFDIFLPLISGCVMCFPNAPFDPTTQNLGKYTMAMNKQIQPTIFYTHATTWNAMLITMYQVGAGTALDQLKNSSVQDAGRRGSKAFMKNSMRPIDMAMYNNIVFDYVKEQLGLSSCRLLYTSPVPPESKLLDMLWIAYLPVFIILGAEETTGPLTVPSPGKYFSQTSGELLPGFEVRIKKTTTADKIGTLCVKGRNVSPTVETVYKNKIDKDGFYDTQLYGLLESEKYFTLLPTSLYDLVYTGLGDIIVPQNIEKIMLKHVPELEHALIFGCYDSFLVCICTIKPKDRSSLTSIGSLPRDDVQDDVMDVCKKLQELIDRINNTAVHPFMRIQSFSILPVRLRTEDGTLTSDGKPARNLIAQAYKDMILSLHE